MKPKIVFDVRHASKVYEVLSFLGTSEITIFALRNFSFRFYAEKTYGLVGESGSGKSTLARLLIGLEKSSSGRIDFESHRIENILHKKPQLFHRNVQMVFQNPARSLDPRWKVREIIAEGLKTLKIKDKKKNILNSLNEVGLSEKHLNRYPHELSGGEQQRVAIARALAVEPRVLILDEPLSHLDVLVQKQILDLLKKLKKNHAITILFITHDLAVAREFCDELLVLRKGVLVESGTTASIFKQPQEVFTKKLLAAIPT